MIRRIALWIGLTAGAAVLSCALNAEVASATGPDLSGLTYGKAAAQISSWGSTPVIATVVGDQLATDDCLVTNSALASSQYSGGQKQGSQFLLNLNCTASVAGPGKPGYSAASEQGRATKKDLAMIAWLNQDPVANVTSSSPAWAKSMCDKYPDDCSADLVDYLGKSK